MAIRNCNGGQNVGAGVLVDAGLVLTCAHVANDALGLAMAAQERPDREISLTLFDAPEDVLKARVDEADDAWSPMKTGKDLCLLRVTSKVTNERARPALLADFNPINNPFRAAGFPQYWQGEFGIAKGSVDGQDGGYYLLRPDPAIQMVAQSMKGGIFTNQKAIAGEISPGFSGGPVEVRGQIVGLIAESRPPTEATAYMIPAASFPSSLRHLVRSFTKAIDQTYPHTAKLRMEIENRRKRTFAGITPFDIRLRFVDSFADALKSQTVSTNSQVQREYDKGVDITPAEFARRLEIGKDAHGNALSTILLHAPGGAGKSSFLMELLSVAADYNLVPFLLDFSRPIPAAVPDKKQDPDDENADAQRQLKAWFTKYEGWGSPSALCELSAEAAGAIKALLVIDGLNQASLNWWKIVGRVDSFSRGELSGAVIIIADRLVKRDPEPSFRRAVIPPLPPATYELTLPKKLRRAAEKDPSWQSILSSPLMLNKAIHMSGVAGMTTGGAAPSRFSILDQYFREGGCGFDKQEMVALSDFAYEAYSSANGTAFGAGQLDKLLKKDPILRGKIENADLIQDLGNGISQFQHQILHDQLAALKVASAAKKDEEVLWRAGAFDVLSLHSASSDAIELTFEALQRPDRLLTPAPRTDLNPWFFLTDVYDWNYRIVLECVASLDRRGDPALRPWMRHAVYGLNLERAFDPFLYTSIRTEQLRVEIPPAPDLTYLDAKSAEDLRKKVKLAISDTGVTTEEERKQFEDWRTLYAREARFKSSELNPLWADPLLSWTAANVIRRLGVDEAVTAELVRLYEISRATSDSVGRAQGFRWRLVHTLGRATLGAWKFLVSVAFDALEGQHVRYGAIRSLVELTVLRGTRGEQEEVFEAIRSKLDSLFPQTPSRGDAGNRRLLRQCCAFNEPSAGGREGWLDDWLEIGLPKYGEILRVGAKLALEHAKDKDEAAAWTLWADTAARVTQEKDWACRLALWKDALGKD
ncbi:MAG TPA: serine protease [Terriglobales bacterium]|nr:serine protease [Terriglobales bacterium]